MGPGWRAKVDFGGWRASEASERGSSLGGQRRGEMGGMKRRDGVGQNLNPSLPRTGHPTRVWFAAVPKRAGCQTSTE